MQGTWSLTSESRLKLIEVEFEFTLKDGCKVKVKGTVNVNILKLEVTGYDLNVTITGTGCGPGTYHVTGRSSISNGGVIYNTVLEFQPSSTLSKDSEFLKKFDEAMAEAIRDKY